MKRSLPKIEPAKKRSNRYIDGLQRERQMQIQHKSLRDMNWDAGEQLLT
jgi:hypothetical protein